MASLNVRIDRTERIAFFSGSGTFHAKEKIKEIGASRARWNPANKEWEIHQFTLSVEELSQHFEDISVEEIGATAETQSREALQSKSSSVTSSTNPRMQEQVSSLLKETSGALNKNPAKRKSQIPEGYSVSALVDEVRTVLRRAFPHTVYLHGVLRSVKEARGGRLYMDLGDPDSPDTIVNCVIWRDADKILAPLTAAGFALEAELQVMFKVEMSINPRRASLSLVVVGVVPEYTLGKLAALREKTNEQLKAEGIFDNNRQRTLPFLPRKLGLLTSSGGTVINDFRASLDEAQFGFELYWMNVSVQGAEAKSSIIKGIQTLAKHTELDAILIFRGGGSAGDLAVFSEYEVAKAVCLSPLPVLSAIGHQEDQSSVQDVSFLAFGVPKDLGRFFAEIVRTRRESVREFSQTIATRSENLVQILQQRVNDVSNNIQAMAAHVYRGRIEALSRLSLQLPLQSRSLASEISRRFSSVVQPLSVIAEQSLLHASQRFLSLAERTRASSERVLERTQFRLQRMESLGERANVLFEKSHRALESLERIISDSSPDTQLKRGFAMVKRASSEELVLRAAEIDAGDEMLLQFIDDSKKVKVQ